MSAQEQVPVVPEPEKTPVQPRPEGEPEHVYLAKESTIPNQHVFSFKYDSPQDGLLHGDFVSKRLTIGDGSQVALERAMLDQGLNVDLTTNEIHNMLAHCKVALIKAPTWWKPLEFYDPWTLVLLYRRITEWEATFRKAIKRK